MFRWKKLLTLCTEFLGLGMCVVLSLCLMRPHYVGLGRHAQCADVKLGLLALKMKTKLYASMALVRGSCHFSFPLYVQGKRLIKPQKK